MNGFTKSIMLISTLVLVIGGGFSLYLTFQANQTVALTHADARGVAIESFDPVAYHTAGAAQKGVANFQVTWAGSIWYFTSLENRQAFSADPEKYAPQYGGYDPLGMATGGAAQPATPELWTIEEGKLYLFYSGETRKIWQENTVENRKEANIKWAKLKQQIFYKQEMAKP
ncbi:MAG: hypothetical protein JKY45_00360 [Emcibacter sp.]|nr:hypothetical protein [Emcibacter sp.]